MGQHLLCFAAQENRGNATASVRCHHYQVALLVLGCPEDSLPGVIAALPNILEFHARSLSVALNHREFFLGLLHGFAMDDRSKVLRNEATRHRTVQWQRHRYADHLGLHEFCKRYPMPYGTLTQLGTVSRK